MSTPVFALRQWALRRALASGLWLAFKQPGGLPLPLPVLRAAMDQAAKLFKPRTDCTAEYRNLGLAQALAVSPLSASKGADQPKGVMLMLHGGAFFAGGPRTHHAMAAQLAARLKATVHVLDYRLAPEHVYPAALEDAMAAYRTLLDEGWKPSQIALCGDSAGGALVLSLVQALQAAGEPLPTCMVLMSPFLDLTLTAPSVKHLARHDPMLSEWVLKRGADAYRGTMNAKDPLVSPLFGNLKGLPPALVQCGSDEILLDDAQSFNAMASAAGTVVTLQVAQGLWHDYQLFHDFLPQAKHALDEVARFVTQHWA